VVGAHIPDFSSEVEFFDLLYLGVFVVLSTAYDDRFYNGQKPPPCLLKEAAFAIGHFHSLLHRFSQRFIIVLDGQAVSISYVVDRMIGEFAAASVVLAKGIYGSDGNDSDDEVEEGIPRSALAEQIESILQKSHPEVFPYYSRCLDCRHKDFLWTGPVVHILPRSVAVASTITLMTEGEILDLPSHSIYTEDLDANLQTLADCITRAHMPIRPDGITQVRKRRGRVDSLNLEEDQAKKRSRKT
jgi:hypothetical protein